MSVYFASVGPYIKIGFSDDPERRVRRLFSSATYPPPGTPRDLASRHLIRYIDGELPDERLIQRALSDFCVGGEWFVDEPEIRDYIASVEYDPDGDYPTASRPTGPAFDPYDESKLPIHEQDLLAAALDRMFARS